MKYTCILLSCLLFISCEADLVVKKEARPIAEKTAATQEAKDRGAMIAEVLDHTTETELHLFRLDSVNRDWSKLRTHQLELEKTLRSIDAAILNISRDIGKAKIKSHAYSEMLTARAKLYECRALILMQLFTVSNVDVYSN